MPIDFLTAEANINTITSIFSLDEAISDLDPAKQSQIRLSGEILAYMEAGLYENIKP